MRIAVFAPDVPYPAQRGGRADVWRRILAFRRLGHQVMLVHLHEPSGPLAPTAADLATIDGVVGARFSFRIKRSPWRTARQLAMAWHTPWHAATRVPTPHERVLLARMLAEFGPDLLWLEGPWFGRAAFEAKALLGCPLAYRSHNIEHQYLRRQAAAAEHLRERLAWRMACWGLRRFERTLMRRADAVFDISIDDAEFWRRQGIACPHWLPPLPQAAIETTEAEPVRTDVLFVGNLQTPNNVRGLEFLLTEVRSRVGQRRPGSGFAIVGSRPTAHARALLADAPDVAFYENVDDVLPFLHGARVLVNPVMTGGGVQLKTLDMLMTDAPVISTPQGVRGLPPDIVALVRLARTPDEFAARICESLDGAEVDRAARDRGRRGFGIEGVQHALADVMSSRH